MKGNIGGGFVKYFICMVMFFCLFSDSVHAVKVTYDSPIKYICFNASTGDYLSHYTSTKYGLDAFACGANQNFDSVKYIDNGQQAYCVNLKKLVVAGDYVVDETWKKDSKNAIMAGRIIQMLEEENLPPPVEHSYIAKELAVNTFFASEYVKDPNSTSFSKFRKYVDGAANYYNNNPVLLSHDMPKLTISINNNNKVMKYLDDNKYVSEKITISGLVAEYGGKNTTYYDIEAKVYGTDTNVNLCNGESGTDCVTKISKENSGDNVSFYLSIDKNKVNSSSSIVVSVIGRNESTYPTTVLYKHATNGSSQKVIKRDSIDVHRVVSQNMTLSIPNLVNHQITAFKVDENGNSLNGATLELYKDNTNASNLLKSNNGSGSSVTYVSPSAAESDEDFFKHDYYLIEKSAPDGYAIVSEVTKFYLKNSGNGTVTTQCYDSNGKIVDNVLCNNNVKVTNSNGNLVVTLTNNKNYVSVSKQAITGDEEVSGAKLKICSASDYDKSKEECEPASTIDDVEMSWISGEKPYVFRGVPVGDYYIIEETAPNGYIKANIATKFSIDKKGTITNDGKVINFNGTKTGAIVVKNQLTDMFISKQDITTSKELSGATLTICQTSMDEKNELQISKDKFSGECVSALLADGTAATWESGSEPKRIQGLPTGTYALVEKMAPNGYALSENVIFTLKADGSLTDKDGNSLTDNKLVMYDKAIREVKTGSLSLYIIIFTLILMTILGIGSYCYVNMVNSNDETVGSNYANTEKKGTKVRQRKIHKKK